ncbi:hypothetical protein [Haloechinothrix sp. LS1_15]|uniref:hypothetical protein n=1 Tax=Haloechinothrix sp. LS1_15 TaxID=2652248 RepID=UPI0029478385|nr:hypothetical protein [Haloechinothrix sp. LS1_15]MDV6012286.1 hypothetical protein [Haloechinothrix sp. LS1_15]
MSADDIFLIENDRLVPLSAQPYPDEDALQDLLARCPDLLAGARINPADPRRWLLVTREAGVPAVEGGGAHWAIDHLFLDQDAIPTFVEVKRSTDTRIRREVVGQMLDYAANGLRYWPAEELRMRLAKRLGSAAEADHAVDGLTGVDDAADEYWERVASNLRSGWVRMVFVADQLPQELRTVIEFLNEQLSLAEVVGIEIRQYEGHGHRALVPQVVGMTATAQQAKGQHPRKPFTELLAESPGAVRELDQRILDWAQQQGYRDTTTGAARKILRADNVPVVLVYPADGAAELDIKRLRAQGNDHDADRIHVTLQELAGRELAPHYPRITAQEALSQFERFVTDVLQPFAALVRPVQSGE